MKFLLNWHYLRKHGMSYSEYTEREAYVKEIQSKIFPPAHDIKTHYYGFRHVLALNHNKTDPCGFSGVPGIEFQELLHKHRGTYAWHRVSWDQQAGLYVHDEFGGGDVFFVAVDDAEAAVMMALLYG